jgi:predicted nucleic acid-binding protein
MSYWDTSALLKLYLQEADSTKYAGIALASATMTSCFIGKHEARTAFRRRETEGALPAGGAAACYQKLSEDVALGRIGIVSESADLEREFGLVIERCLSQTPPVFVRTNDAIHLAAARVAGETEFVTADIRQRAAAQFLGFTLKP